MSCSEDTHRSGRVNQIRMALARLVVVASRHHHNCHCCRRFHHWDFWAQLFLGFPTGLMRSNWNDAEKISMAPVQYLRSCLDDTHTLRRVKRFSMTLAQFLCSDDTHKSRSVNHIGKACAQVWVPFSNDKHMSRRAKQIRVAPAQFVVVASRYQHSSRCLRGQDWNRCSHSLLWNPCGDHAFKLERCKNISMAPAQFLPSLSLSPVVTTIASIVAVVINTGILGPTPVVDSLSGIMCSNWNDTEKISIVPSRAAWMTSTNRGVQIRLAWPLRNIGSYCRTPTLTSVRGLVITFLGRRR